ncbi:MAG: hypothetical protein J5965_05635 [Aeriscardovia sp.]|nr:hypothetical protein [Aeriscardovia sp.]
MRQGYVTEIKRQGDSNATPICDEEAYALGQQHTSQISGLSGRVLSLEETLAYLNSSNTWFGCKWPIGNSESEGTPVGNLFRLKHMQEIFKIGGYMVKDDHSRRKLHKSDHRIYEEGDAVDFTGAHGHYQWGWGVGLWYGAWEDTSYEYDAFDDRPIPGVPCVYIPVGSRSCAGWAQLDRTNNKLVSYINKTAQYRGGNNSNWDETYRSLIGKPVSDIDMTTLRNYARNNGSMWFTTERVMIFITGALARVFFHNRDIQAAYNATLTADGLHQGGLGYGISVPGDWGDRGYNPYIDLDCGIEKGDFTGLLSTTIKDSEDNDVAVTGIPCFMGLKNFYKYLWTMTENELLVCQADGSQAFYVEENIDGSVFNTDGAGTHLLVGKTPVHASGSWSYIKKISKAYLSGMPVEDGGSGSTYYADGYYNPVAEAGAVRGAVRLGHAYYGGNAGSCFLTGDDVPSHAHASGGAVLCEFTVAFSTKLAVIA